MNVQKVKSAPGRRVRDPKSGNVLPNVADENAADTLGVAVDLDDPYWFRSKAGGDIVLVDDAGAEIAAKSAPQAAAPAVPASSQAAPASAQPVSTTAAPAPAAASAATGKSA